MAEPLGFMFLFPWLSSFRNHVFVMKSDNLNVQELKEIYYVAVNTQES